MNISMTYEELVCALRNNVGVPYYSRRAADRIEQLLEGGQGLAEVFAAVAVKLAVLESKLAKATEALEEIGSYTALQMLAELEKEE